MALDPENLLYLAGLGRAYARAGATGDAPCEEGAPWIGYLGVDPGLDLVRGQARFRQLLSRVRLPR